MNCSVPWINWAPGIARLRAYRRGWLRGDVAAGVTVAAYLVPQVMAYATVAGLSPIAGLRAALVPLAAYVAFGSSRQLSVGPESTTALMILFSMPRWRESLRYWLAPSASARASRG